MQRWEEMMRSDDTYTRVRGAGRLFGLTVAKTLFWGLVVVVVLLALPIALAH